MEIEFTTKVFKEGKTYVAYTPELDVSSCGRTEECEAPWKSRGAEADQRGESQDAIAAGARQDLVRTAGISRDEYLKLLKQ